MIKITVNCAKVVMTCNPGLWPRACLIDLLEDQSINEICIEHEEVSQIYVAKEQRAIIFNYFGPKDTINEDLDFGDYEEVFKSGSHLDKEVYAGYLLMKLHNIDNRRGVMVK